MSDQTVTLRIRTDAGGTVTAVQGVVAEVDKIGGAAQRAGRESGAGFAQTRTSASTAAEVVRNLRQQVLGFFGIAAGAAAIRTVVGLADEYTNLQSRIRLVTDSQAQANAVGAQVFQVAQQTRSELSATGQLYTTLARSTADLGLSQQQLAQITRTVNQTFTVSGASADSARAAIVQLSQGLASGALRGDEFNSVAEQAPIIMDVLAKSLGKSRGELREFAAQGGITAKILTDSLLAGAVDVQTQFDGMAVTIGGATTQISNAFTRFVGETSNASGAASGLASLLSGIANNFTALASASLVVGAAFGVRLVAQLGASALAWAANGLQVVGYNASLLRLGATSPVVVAGLRGVTVAASGLSAALGPISLAIAAVGALAIGLSSAIVAERERRQAFEVGIDSLRSTADEANRLAIGYRDVNAQVPPLAASIRQLSASTQASTQAQTDLNVQRERLLLLIRAELGLSASLAQAQERAAGGTLSVALARQVEEFNRLETATRSVITANTDLSTALFNRLAPAFGSTSDAIDRVGKADGLIDTFERIGDAAAELSAQVRGLTVAESAFSAFSATLKTQSAEADKALANAGKSAIQVAQAFVDAGIEAAAASGNLTDELIAQGRAYVDTVAKIESAKSAVKDFGRAQRDAAQATEEARKAGETFRAETAKMVSQLAGPSAEAFAEYASQIAEANALLAQGGISVGDFAARQAVALEALNRTTDAIAAQRAPIDQMLADLQFEATLFGLSNTEREVAIALRQIEADAIENNKTLTEAEIEARKREVAELISANAAQAQVADAAAQAASDYQRAWQGATDSVARAFGDFVVSGAQKFKSLGQSLKNIAKSFLADLVAMFLRNQLTLRVTGAAGGLGASGSSFASSLSGLFGQGSASSSPFNGSGPLASFAGQGTATSQSGFSGFFSQLFSQGGQGGSSSGGFGGGASVAGGIGGGLFGGLIGGKAGATGGSIGGSIGGNFGPWGAAIGAVIGSVAGTIIGNKFQTVLSGSNISIGAGGAVGSLFEDQKKKGGLFGSNKRRTKTSDLPADAQQAIDDLFNAVSNSVAAAAASLGIDTPAIVAGAFRQEFDKKGNLKREFSTIAGRVVDETQAQFAQRLQALNIVAVIDKALGSSEASQVAEQFAGNADKLLQGAQFLLGASVDLRNGFNLLGDGSLSRITGFTVELANAGEPLVETYARLVAGSALLDEALKLSGVSIDGSREQFVRFSAGIVDAAGGLDRATSLWQGYFQRFFSDNERAASALSTAQTAAQTQVGDIGLTASDFASTEGLAQFRELFEEVLPTLSADAVVQWLEAAQAIGAVIDAQDALNQTLGETVQAVDEAAQALAEELAAMLDGVRAQARDAADALADFGLSDLAARLAQVARETGRAIDAATALGATESDLAEIRALGVARAELIQRQARADLAVLLDGVSQSLFELDATPLETELSRIALAMQATLDQASALGATEAELARIRELGARQSAAVIETEVQRLRDAFGQLAQSIGQTRQSIADDILNIRRTQPGFSESGFQSSRIGDLRAQLDGAVDPQERIGLIDQIRQATLARFNAELAAIQQTDQAQQQASQAAQQAIAAQREALSRLRDFADGLGLSSNSPLTAFQRLDVARSQFDSLLGRARGGDTDAIGGLQQAADALLSENRNVFGVSQIAVDEFNRVQQELRAVAGQGVRGVASFSDPFQRASIDTASRIAQLQADAIGELQSLDDTLAALRLTQEAQTEGSVEALRARSDQAEVHKDEIVAHILPIVDAISQGKITGDQQLAEARRQTDALQAVLIGVDGQQAATSAFLDKFLVWMGQQKDQSDQQQAEIARMARAIETAVKAVRA